MIIMVDYVSTELRGSSGASAPAPPFVSAPSKILTLAYVSLCYRIFNSTHRIVDIHYLQLFVSFVLGLGRGEIGVLCGSDVVRVWIDSIKV